MKRQTFTLVITIILQGCSSLNIIDDGHGLCRSLGEEYPESLYTEAQREAKKEPPNGYLTQPYSRKSWDSYWNHRIFYMWDLGPKSCGGTYQGLLGPELINMLIAKRRELGLPEIALEERNSGKEL
jgi:hypothetical protein